MFIFGCLEPFDQLADIPFCSGDLILLLRKVHLPSVELAPVLLVADSLGKSQYDLVFECGLAQLADLFADALVECRERFTLLENPLQQPFPFRFAGIQFFVAHGVVASRSVLEFEEQETVEEPVLFAVGKLVCDIGTEFIDCPVQPVAAALVDQSQVLDAGRLVVLCGGRRPEGREYRPKGAECKDP